MSVKVMGAVFDLDLSPNQKLVLLAYADHANHDGSSIFPGQAAIAEKTSYTLRSIVRITQELGTLGYLKEDGRAKHGLKRWRIPFEDGVITPEPCDKIAHSNDGNNVLSETEECAICDTDNVLSEPKNVLSAPNNVLSETQENSDLPLDSPVDESLNRQLTVKEPSIEPSINLQRFSKNDKTPLAQAKASLLRDLFGGRVFVNPPPEFERMYGVLKMVSIEWPVVVLSHPEQEVMQDDRVLRPLVRALADELGAEVEVRFEA